MHPVLGMIKFKSFEGEYPIHGTVRDVVFMDTDAAAGKSVLAIHGLSVEDALHILDRLRDGLLTPAELKDLPAVSTRPAQPAKPPKGGARGVPEGKAAPRVQPVAVVPDEVDEPDVDDADEDEGDEAQPGLTAADKAACTSMTKLREFVSLAWERGLRDDAIVFVAESMKATVPALVELEKKGPGFDRRMRSAVRMFREMYVETQAQA